MKVSFWFVVIASVFVTSLITANIIAVKLILFLGFLVPAGIIVFPLSYLFGDVLTEVYGYGAARRVIWLGFACNLLAVIAIYIGGIAPAAPFWTQQAAYNSILGFTPRLLLASFTAYLVGEFANSFVLAKLKIATKGRWLWTRTIGSTLIGEGLEHVNLYQHRFLGNHSGKYDARSHSHTMDLQSCLRNRCHSIYLPGSGFPQKAREPGYLRLSYELQSGPLAARPVWKPEQLIERTLLVRGQVAPVFRAWSLVIRRSMLGEDDRLDIAAYGEIGDHAHPARREQRNQVIQYGIGCRLVADLAVAIFIDVEL